MRLSHTLVLASNNRGKFEEFRTLLAAYPELELAPASAFMRNSEQLAFVERFDTYAENAIAKARFANRGCHYPALADDSGLEVEGLDGKPGVRSHRYAPPPTVAAGQNPLSQDQANMNKLLLDLGRGSAVTFRKWLAKLLMI
jgi:XTP/dITP diphosphohydrolase